MTKHYAVRDDIDSAIISSWQQSRRSAREGSATLKLRQRSAVLQHLYIWLNKFEKLEEKNSHLQDIKLELLKYLVNLWVLNSSEYKISEVF